jgi:hypothetical protein
MKWKIKFMFETTNQLSLICKKGEPNNKNLGRFPIQTPPDKAWQHDKCSVSKPANTAQFSLGETWDPMANSMISQLKRVIIHHGSMNYG